AHRLERPRLHVVGPRDAEDVDEARAKGRIFDRHHDLDAAMEVSRHPIGARDVDLVLAGVREVEDATVLEVAVDDRADLDVLRDAGQPGPETADAADDERDG